MIATTHKLHALGRNGHTKAAMAAALTHGYDEAFLVGAILAFAALIVVATIFVDTPTKPEKVGRVVAPAK